MIASDEWKDYFLVKYITHLQSGFYIICKRSGQSIPNPYMTEDEAIVDLKYGWWKVMQKCDCKNCKFQQFEEIFLGATSRD